MRVKDEELREFIAEFGRRNTDVNRERLLAVLKGRFYNREDPRQLLYRLEHIGLTETTTERIRIKTTKHYETKKSIWQ